MRIGEICALKLSEIDFEDRTIHINNTVSRIPFETKDHWQPKTKLLLSNAKTSTSNRVIPITSTLYNILLEMKNSESEYLIKGAAYPYTDPRTLQYFFKKTLKKCNLRDINFHALRHSFATRCIESGMDIKSLSEILGHSNVNITLNTYVHSTVILKRKQLEAMIDYCGI